MQNLVFKFPVNQKFQFFTFLDIFFLTNHKTFSFKLLKKPYKDFQ